MYAVIFKAVINKLDDDYLATAKRLRELALNQYSCTEFIACSENGKEIAISYWPSEDHIKAWHGDPEHRKAQMLGKEKWYKSYEVNITKVIR